MTKRIALSMVAALGFVLSAHALDVDETELSSTGERTIEFINYEGPHEVIESAESIRAIGRALGTAVASGAARSGSTGRYFVIHAVDPTVPVGLDADIIVLGEGALVDHVRNLRRIVAGFLETAYGYSARDADTLAIFITIYNAVYRGDLGYFGSKYKQVVAKELSASNAGLSVRWDEWAGRSRIVIPLTAKAGTGVLGSVDTTPITDESTVGSLREESPTGGIDERMDIVDIKERGQDEEKAAIDAERDRIAREEAAIAAEKERREADTGAVDRTAGEAGSADAGETPDDEAAQGLGAGQEASLEVSEKAREEDAAAARELAEREARVEADKAALAAREEASAAKDQEIAKDRDAIATDQKDAIRDEVTAAADREASGVVLFELVNPDAPLSRIALVDLKTGDTIRRSSLNTIRASSIVDVGDAYVAVAGQITGTGGLVRLVRVAKADYSDVVQGADDVFADTMLWKYGSSLYAVVKKGGDWVIGRFDQATLELKASSEPVSRWTFLTQSGGRLVAQGPGGAFLVLEAEALTTASELRR